MKLYKYDNEFFDFVDRSSYLSASHFLPKIFQELKPASILDVGCGRGVWLKIWHDYGVVDITGIDGEYIDEKKLHIDTSQFLAKDLKLSFNLERKYDLVECLEVAEHLPEVSADILIDNLVRHGNIILFSAAQVGQGGEYHVNEQSVSYWMEKFRNRGFKSFDYPRIQVKNLKEIEPWYRYNTVLYANDQGMELLSDAIKETLIVDDNSDSYMSLSWKFRCFLLAHLPQNIVHKLAQIKHVFLNKKSKRK